MAPSSITRLLFVHLAGTPPSELQLPDLPDARQVYTFVLNALGHFLADQATTIFCDDLDTGPAWTDVGDGWTLVYVYGHAWPEKASYTTMAQRQGTSVALSAQPLLNALHALAPGPDMLLIIDTCHAALFEIAKAQTNDLRAVVWTSGSDEAAISLPLDKTSRFAAELAKTVNGKRDKAVDFISLILDVRHRLLRDSIVLGQTVGYALYGPAVTISRRNIRPQRPRDRSTRLFITGLSTMFLSIGVILAWLTYFYTQNVLVELDLNSLEQVIKQGEVLVVIPDLDQNQAREVRRSKITARRARLWIPARNSILTIQATYKDGAERVIAYPLSLTATLSIRRKYVTFRLPPVNEVNAHPGMAYIPVRELHEKGYLPEPGPTASIDYSDPNMICELDHESTVGIGDPDEPQTVCSKPLGQELISLKTSFWIDLAPPTVSQYTALAAALVRRQKIKKDQILLFQLIERTEALQLLDVKPMTDLGRTLSIVLNQISQAQLPHPAGQGEMIIPNFKRPCSSCSAPMGPEEAQNYCALRKGHLPTVDEWILSVGGTDGRLYPWGNRFDAALANIPGLPKIMGVPNTLMPVTRYPTAGPFGLIDTVGNAGDWIQNAEGETPDHYAGGTYENNPEDGAIRSILPAGSEPNILSREITARCVQPA